MGWYSDGTIDGECDEIEFFSVIEKSDAVDGVATEDIRDSWHFFMFTFETIADFLLLLGIGEAGKRERYKWAMIFHMPLQSPLYLIL